MDKIIQHTGGIVYIDIALEIMALLALIIIIIPLIISIKKNNEIVKAQKINYISSIVTILVQALLAGYIMGRYMCLYEIL